MAVTLTELVDSREWSGGSVTFHYRLTGTSDDATAKTLLLSSSPSTYGSLVREPEPSLKATWTDSTTSNGEWDCSVRFSPRATEIGQVSISGDTAGGTMHLTQCLSESGAYAPSGKTAPASKGAIGVGTDGQKLTVEGVDIIVPVFKFTVTKVFAADALPNLGTIFSLTGKVNSDTFTVTDTKTRITVTLAAGECLFTGAQFGSQRSDGGVEITYSFSGSPNRSNFTVGSITVTGKKGWEYMWVRYEDAEDSAAKALVKKAVAVYVQKVYENGALSGLGLSGNG
jgi:hypothetical protein